MPDLAKVFGVLVGRVGNIVLPGHDGGLATESSPVAVSREASLGEVPQSLAEQAALVAVVVLGVVVLPEGADGVSFGVFSVSLFVEGAVFIVAVFIGHVLHGGSEPPGSSSELIHAKLKLSSVHEFGEASLIPVVSLELFPAHVHLVLPGNHKLGLVDDGISGVVEFLPAVSVVGSAVGILGEATYVETSLILVESEHTVAVAMVAVEVAEGGGLVENLPEVFHAIVPEDIGVEVVGPLGVGEIHRFSFCVLIAHISHRHLLSGVRIVGRRGAHSLSGANFSRFLGLGFAGLGSKFRHFDGLS